MVLFKDLKRGAQVFKLNRNTLEYDEGIVGNVGMPYAPPATTTKLSQPILNLLVDVAIDFGGTTKTFVIPDSHSLTAVGDEMLSTDKESILNEVRAIRTQSEQVINSVEKHKDRLTRCNTLIADLDQTFRERQQTEARFSAIEEKMEVLCSKFDDFLRKME